MAIANEHSTKARGAKATALVLGGGFAGVDIAIKLRKAGLAVTLVSERRHMLVYPTSIWVVTGEHRIEQDLIDLQDLASQHGFELLLGKVEAVHPEHKGALVDGREVSADILVLALGASRKPLPGIEHTVTVWGGPADTVAVYEHLDALLAKGEGRVAVGFGGNPADPSAMRGGPAFEVMFNIVNLLKRRRLRDRFALTFFAPMAKPGERMGERAAATAREQLLRQGVSLAVGKKLEGFDEGGVRLEGGGRVDADLVVYIPAGAGHPAVRNSGLPLNEAGFVRIEGTCAVPGFENIYAIGDVAALEGPDWRAKQGHLAEIMADVAADAIVRHLGGEAVRKSYIDRVSIVCLMDTGDGAALVQRDSRRARLVLLPVVGHWLKKAWGYYYRFTKYRWGRWLRWAAHELVSRGGARPLPARE